MWKSSVRTFRATRRPLLSTAYPHRHVGASFLPDGRSARGAAPCHRRCFHEYFITHIPSSSMHPEGAGPSHRLPRDKSTPHEPRSSKHPAATMVGSSREMTVVRIPLKSAKHHFGVSLSRGSRPYNEDAFQAGTIEIPAFAKRRPVSLTRNASGALNSSVTPAGSATGDPQVFYFGVFDGHGGAECSGFLREELHAYLEEATKTFELESTLGRGGRVDGRGRWVSSVDGHPEKFNGTGAKATGRDVLDAIQTHTPAGVEPVTPPKIGETEEADTNGEPLDSAPPVVQSESVSKAEKLERRLISDWKELVGGYFRRFKPEYFSLAAGGRGHPAEKEVMLSRTASTPAITEDATEGIGIETVLQYTFLKADYDFVSAQVGKREEDTVLADKAINDDDILGQPSRSVKHIGGTNRFKGGSTCSVALISTPTPIPFWHPASPSSLITAHVGDTRILLCETATGLAVPLTSDHHPSLPEEANRLRRYAAAFVTDSFGQERMSGLANTRAFGDMAWKRIGVSAEPEIRRIELQPAQYSFLAMVSDGVSGPLSDQEIVDIVKEAKTPDQAARDVTSFATEVSTDDADNATALVVRLGGWERRSEGGLGSLGTKEMRDWKKNQADEPRSRRM